MESALLRKLFPAALLAALLLSLSACGDDDPDPQPDADTTELPDDDTSPDGDVDEGFAQLRVIHLSADAPAVDVFANGGDDAAVSELAFGESSAYLSLPAATYDFAVSASGSPASAAVLNIDDAMLEVDGAYTAVAYDRLASISALLLVDELGGIAAGEIRVRAIHTAPDVGEVDIWALGATPSPLFTDLAYGAPSPTADLPASAHVLGIDVDDDAVPDLVYDIPALPELSYVNIFAVQDGEGAVFLHAQFEDGSTVRIDARESPMEKAMLRVAHISPDAPAVDVFANGAEPAAVSALAFPASTGYLELDPGTYDFAIAAAGSAPSAAVLTIEDAALEAGLAYTAVAYDRLASLSALLLVDELEGIDPGEIRVRAIHTAPDVGEVDIWAIAEPPAPLFVDLGYAEASAVADLPATAHTVGIDVDNDASPDLIFAIPALPGGSYVNLFAVQDGDGAVFLNAQFEDGSTVRIDPEPAMGGKAMIRVLHLSPDAPEVDLFANAATPALVSDLAYREGTEYVEVDAGSYDIAIAPAGGTPVGAVLTVEDLALEADKKYTAVAYGELASLQALALEDADMTAAADQIKIRAIHAATAVGEVDIWNLPAQGEPGLLYENVPFGGVGGYLDLPAQAYTLGIDVDNDAAPDLVFSLPALPGGTIANVFAVSDAEGVALIAQLQTGAPVAIDPDGAKVSVLHLSPDAPDVDLFVNNGMTPALVGLAFGESTGYLDVPAGTYDFDVAPTGAGIGAAVISLDDAVLGSGTRTTAIAFDNVAALKSMVLSSDVWGVPAGSIRVRAIHAAAGVGQVDIWEVSGTPTALYPDFDFAEIGDYIEIPAGAYTLGFDVNNDASPDLSFALPALPAGTVADVFAVTDAGGVFLFVQFADGSTARIDD